MAQEIFHDIVPDGHAVDAAVGVISFIAISTAWMDWLDIVFKVLIGFLTVILLLQRIYVGYMRYRRRR